MCGRYTLIKLAEFTDMFPWIRGPDSAVPGRFNVAPSQAVAVVANTAEPKVDFYSWGLVPSWAKDRSIGNKMINARAETLAEKPAFRTALRRRRCLLPADGFYEWKVEGKTKTPMYITRADGKPFAFAGLWEMWHAADGSALPSCTIITVAPNDLMKTIHDRMPAMLAEEDYRAWLEPAEKETGAMMGMLRPYPAELLTVRPVSRVVNSPKNEGPDCIAPLVEDKGLFG